MENNFTFCVFAYNHEKYILEHLESIKYQIETHGQGIDSHLIINDDHSTDNTIRIIEAWLSFNESIFCSVRKIYNKKNIGTSKSLINVCDLINTKHCKITAGDDVYTFHNIFEFVNNYPEYSILSGIPIRLYNEKLKVNLFESFNYHASNVIYKKSKLIDRLSNISIINAPNLFYSTKYLKNTFIISFLENFDVVEDWSLQIAISQNDTNSNITSTNVPIVFYRRTEGSAYIVASGRFIKDKSKLFNHLIEYYYKDKKPFSALLLKNRKYLLTNPSFLIRNLFNLSRFIYFIRLLINFPEIYRNNRYNSFNISEYQKYYDKIKKSANSYEI